MKISTVAKASTAGWVVLLIAFVALMAAGAQRDSSPATPQERVESVARRLACPTCDGESVAESRGAASQAIRQEISRLVAEGMLSDDEIVTTIDDSYAEDLRLEPGSSGIEALVWILPFVAGAVAVVGLALAFRRWRTATDMSSRADDVSTTSKTSGHRPAVRAVAGTVVVLALAVAAGIAVARNTGERRPGQGMTGSTGETSISALLAEARSLGMGDIDNALGLYAQVLESEPNNVEALSYFGWLTVLSASQLDDPELAAARLESGLVLLRQATVVDPGYPDAHCFLGIAFFRFLDDAQAAQPEIETCLASDPPSEVAALVEGLAQRITDALGDGSIPNDTTAE